MGKIEQMWERVQGKTCRTWEARKRDTPRKTNIMTLGDQENDGAIYKTGKSGRRSQFGRQHNKFKLGLSSASNQVQKNHVCSWKLTSFFSHVHTIRKTKFHQDQKQNILKSNNKALICYQWLHGALNYSKYILHFVWKTRTNFLANPIYHEL